MFVSFTFLLLLLFNNELLNIKIILQLDFFKAKNNIVFILGKIKV